MLLYFAGSMIMDIPTDECVTDFWLNGRLNQLPVSSSNPRFIKAAALLRDSCSDKNQCRQMLIEDYFRLFEANGIPLAPAYESLYIKAENTPVKLTEKVSDFYNSYGWESRLRGKIPDDHLGIELLFLTRLIDKYILLDDEPSCCELKKEIIRFTEQHLLSWVSEWNEEIQEHSHNLCYKGIGTLIYACIEDLHGIFSRL